jgi:ERCC4-related helicase
MKVKKSKKKPKNNYKPYKPKAYEPLEKILNIGRKGKMDPIKEKEIKSNKSSVSLFLDQKSFENCIEKKITAMQKKFEESVNLPHHIINFGQNLDGSNDYVKKKHEEREFQEEFSIYMKTFRKNILFCSTPMGPGFMSYNKAYQIGYLPGYPDIFIPEPSGKYNGLYIELKTIKGQCSKNQKYVIDRIKKLNYKVLVCKCDIDLVKKQLNNYFRNGNLYEKLHNNLTDEFDKNKASKNDIKLNQNQKQFYNHIVKFSKQQYKKNEYKNEDKLQFSITKYLRTQRKDIVFSSMPMGPSFTNIKAASKIGYKNGFPDMFLLNESDRFDFRGWFIELKTDKGIVSNTQKKVITQLRKRNYLVTIIRSLTQFKFILNKYLPKK